jgi:RND family efflux transporter MFP subunit
MRLSFRLIVLGTLAVFFFAGCGEEVTTEEPVRPVRAMKVGDVATFTGRSFPGVAKATREVDLSFRVAGPLITRPVDVGDEVKENQVVARIDPRDYEVNLRNVEGQLVKTKAEVERAESDYDRVARARERDPGAVSETVLDAARQSRDGAQAEVTSLEAAVDSAKDQLKYTYLRAPFDGTVVATYVENYEYVKARQSIVRVLDTSRIEMIVYISASLISYAPQAKNIRVRFDPFPDRELKAEIKEVGKEASQETRTYPVTLIMDQPGDIKILPGMAGRAAGEGRLPQEAGRTGIEIPVSAVFSPDEAGKTYVWVIDEGAKTVSRREVKTGKITDVGIVVLDGLEAGEWIATAGVHYLREGQEVRIQEQSAQEVS